MVPTGGLMTRQPPEEPNPASMTPAELTDPYARPEVVDPALVKNLDDIASAAPSEGTGVTGNLGEISIDPPPASPPPTV
jgi:hypothetical protein